MCSTPELCMLSSTIRLKSRITLWGNHEFSSSFHHISKFRRYRTGNAIWKKAPHFIGKSFSRAFYIYSSLSTSKNGIIVAVVRKIIDTLNRPLFWVRHGWDGIATLCYTMAMKCNVFGSRGWRHCQSVGISTCELYVCDSRRDVVRFWEAGIIPEIQLSVLERRGNW